MSISHPSLLCFDGGGVRGLSSLYLAKQLMESINQDAPPKPCEVFDMIGGTSTGGLIAIMLGRLEMSVDECIKQYIALSRTVFKREHYLPFRKRDGSIQARFSTSALEAAIKKIVAESDVAKAEGSGENALMRTKSRTKCRTFVVALSKHFADDHAVFSSYSRPREADRELFDNTKIWEAARATSAASTFFDSINIGDPPVSFVDGGVGRNNPLPVLWDEAGIIWGGRDGDQLDARVRYVVSIGTGMSLPGPFGNNLVAVFETLKATATETEQTANAFVRNHRRLVRENRYFRFNVTQGLEDVGLEEYDKLSTIRSATTRYGEDPMVQMALIRFEDTVMAARHDGASNSNVSGT
ncbi:hypothetical protein W97_01353 [Coniosporium apollinis CBS 100218]|uniref:PNPLA domain-containing protein n=1 Tax=Coniosporium apollinis (strain CBS 100218) TaxID=1168221 RepID=R7YK13_CONA1|nr:uncharacterized protein W97_01353 [Coniosporium apollinis CBS 100218]EON62134.1 hypothetical protein W97_01353 [Coniosporium apollinis CBS 100218]